jgi:hypothetical protein
MSDCTPEQLSFPPVNGFTVRGEFNGGALSSDFGPMILRGVDQQTGLIKQLSAAIHDQRHPSYIDHPLEDLVRQRIFQVACGYEDANDANALRQDPLFKLGLERTPLDADQDLASGPTFSRLENAVTARDLYRMAQVFVDQFIASYAEPPEVIVLDMDHTDDPIHGQQELALFNHYYGHHCYMPLFLFEGLSGRFITAALRPGKRPKGAENAMIIGRVVRRLRQHWPETHIVLRGDSHFANVELMRMAADDAHLDFIFGLSGNAVLKKQAQPIMEGTRALHAVRCHNTTRMGQPPPESTRQYHEFTYQAGSWPEAFRVILKAEVMNLGDNPRFVVTSLTTSTPAMLYQEIYCARGQDENFIKMMKNDLASDRTSDHRFLANQLRLFFACAAYVLHHTLRTELLVNTELAQAQPQTVMLKLFKLAVRVVQYKDRIKLQLPSHCTVKRLLHRVTAILHQVGPPTWNTS